MSESIAERMRINAMINEQVRNLDAFIKEVLDYSRNARLTLNVVPVSPFELVNKIIAGLNHMQGFDQVTISNKINPNVTVNTDPERLQVIITNLLVNAIIYRDSDKRVSTVTLEAVSEKDTWQFLISDNGVGIQEEHQEKIFEMFYRANDRIGTGSGLGLYIVREATERLKGAISLESEYKEGSTFKIEFANWI